MSGRVGLLGVQSHAETTHRKRKRLYEGGFVIAGVIGVLLIAIGTYRGVSGQSRMQAALDSLGKGQVNENAGIGQANRKLDKLVANSTPIHEIAPRSVNSPPTTTAVKKVNPRPSTSSEEPYESAPSRSVPIPGSGNRHILVTQKLALIKSLNPISGQVAPVDVICTLGDGEGCQYAQELFATLKEAGWNVGEAVSQAIFNNRISGVLIQVPSREAPGAGRLQSALKAVGIQAKGALSSTVHPRHIELIVGYTPES